MTKGLKFMLSALWLAMLAGAFVGSVNVRSKWTVPAKSQRVYRRDNRGNTSNLQVTIPKSYFIRTDKGTFSVDEKTYKSTTLWYYN